VFLLLDEVIEEKRSGFQQTLHAGILGDPDDAIRGGGVESPEVGLGGAPSPEVM